MGPARRVTSTGTRQLAELDTVRLAELALSEVVLLGSAPAPLDDADLFVLTALAVFVPEAVAEVLAPIEATAGAHARRNLVALAAARYALAGASDDLLAAASLIGASTAVERRCSAHALGLVAARHSVEDEAWGSVLTTALRTGREEGEWVACAVAVASMSGAEARKNVASVRGRSSTRARLDGPLARLLGGEAVGNEFFGPFFWRLGTALLSRLATRVAFAGRSALLVSPDAAPTEFERRAAARELLARPGLRVRADAFRARLDTHALGGWFLRAPLPPSEV